MKNKPEYMEMFKKLVNEYDQRLEQQVKLAKDDMLHELEVQIQVRPYYVINRRDNKYQRFVCFSAKSLEKHWFRVKIDGASKTCFLTVLVPIEVE